LHSHGRVTLVWALIIAWWALFISGCGVASQGEAASVSPNSPAGQFAKSEAAPGYDFNDDAPEEAPLMAGQADRRAAGKAPREAIVYAGSSPPQSNLAVVPPVAEAIGSGTAPLLIYNATVTLAVFEAERVIDAIEQLATQNGGYLVKRSDRSITVRVPAQVFKSVLETASKQGDELHREVDVRDVTEEFHDLEIRLRNAEAMLVRLEALLNKAQDVKEALAVEKELARIAETIELYKGKLKLLKELVAFSTITVELAARPIDQVGSTISLPFPWLRQLGLPELLNLETP
jgi:hypothetical protein